MKASDHYGIPIFQNYLCNESGKDWTGNYLAESGELGALGKAEIDNPIARFLSGRLRVIEASIRQLLREIEEREKLRDRLLTELDKQYCEVKDMLYQVAPCGSAPFTIGEPKRRASIEHELMSIESERRREETSAWRDISGLKRELRVLVREYLEEKRRQDAVMPP